MKKILLIFTALLLASSCFCQEYFNREKTEKFVREMVENYPLCQLADIYKSCYQDVFGSDHLVSDTATVMKYLDSETGLQLQYRGKDYEPCGLEGNFIRVNTALVTEGKIDRETLCNGFIASSHKPHLMTVEEWKLQWHKILETIQTMNLNLEGFESDSEYIEKLIDSGHYAWVHSRRYKKAYEPHYRIIEKSIFEKEILPRIK